MKASVTPRTILLALILAVASLVVMLLAAPSIAHEGHDHGAPPPPVSTTIAPRADASSEDFEIVLVARDGRLQIFLDTFRGNEPVHDATIEIDGPQGTVKAEPDGAGGYGVAAPWLEQPGDYALAITVQARGMVDILTASLVIPAPIAAPPVAAGRWGAIIDSALAADLRTRIADGGMTIYGALAAAFAAGFLVALLLRRRPATAAAALALALAASDSGLAAPLPVAAPGSAAAVAARDIAQRFPDGALFVPKSTQRILGIRTLFTEVRTYARSVELPGRVIPDPNRAGYVQASVAGRLVPPPGGFPRLGARVAAGDLLALVQPAINSADSTAQQLQARELEQQMALGERRLERLRQIQSVVARAQIEDAELELAGLRLRRANLDRAPREPERLVAPVSGVVASVQAIAGQIADPVTAIYLIIDPDSLWVEALSFEVRALAAEASGRLADGGALSLVYRGSGLADRNQAVPIQFSIEGKAGALRPGQLLTVLARSTAERRGIALPRTAVVRGANGQSIVYAHANAERFVPMEIRVEPLDGNHVLAISGIEPGRRIVVQGAELLNQVR
ncbi:MAG: efflux RND transporter periplasmic adaptor subunit [Phreatobacter sp.]|uniref:efflux RND transporter periplasmic adaptor subunit n=1 Tax=Phreatobacter sp. TaxID=1966341 RepID=UPI002732E2FC|nr:efflux RND transporter periplasmic adaptor subunit [Phreatobacter sp.]MDP2803039.1 efflux RND transporter periplasmic adaptor subunit [Phreatobacter sp.]